MVNILSIIIGILVVAFLIMRESYKSRIAELNRDNRELRRAIAKHKATISNLEDELETAQNNIINRNREILKMIGGYKNDIHKG